MKLKLITTLPISAALVLMPALSHAAPTASTVANTPGIVELTHELDAKKLMPNETIQARLEGTVHLANGTKLPDGTWLTAKVVRDAVHPDHVRLALRFTQARLKDGKVIPIKATILDVSPNAYNNGLQSSRLAPDNLNNMKDRFDVLDVVSGVDLHSRASSMNSGVFVSKTKDDVKLPYGTEMELALSSPSGTMQ